LGHVRVDVAKVGSWTSYVRLRVIIVRRTRGVLVDRGCYGDVTTLADNY